LIRVLVVSYPYLITGKLGFHLSILDTHDGRYKIIPIRTEIIKFCENVGFDYLGAIIWQKVTTCHTTGGATVMGSFPYPRSGITLT
jgi:DNA modification methylase